MRDLARPCGINLSAPMSTTSRNSRSLSPAPVPLAGVSLSTNTSPTTAPSNSTEGVTFHRSASERAGAKLERSNSVVGRSGLTLMLVPSLSPSQVLTIRRSWKHVNTKGLQEVVKKCFQKLERTNPATLMAFSSNPTITCPSNTAATNPVSPTSLQPSNSEMGPSKKHSFAQKPICVQSSATNIPQQPVRSVVEHSRFFLGLLDRIIENDQDVYIELKAIGARHVVLHENYGVGVPEIEHLGEIIAEAFFKLDGIRQSKETTKAWRILISQIIDLIRDGFETEIRFQKRRNFFHNASQQNQQQNCFQMTENDTDLSNTQYGDSRRNSMPSSRKTSLRVEISSITRKLSNL